MYVFSERITCVLKTDAGSVHINIQGTCWIYRERDWSIYRFQRFRGLFSMLEIIIYVLALQSLLNNLSPDVSGNTGPCDTSEEVPDPIFRRSAIVEKALRLMGKSFLGDLRSLVSIRALYAGDGGYVHTWDDI